jgi:hypothetical protein
MTEETLDQLTRRLKADGISEDQIGAEIGARIASEKAPSDPFQNFRPIGGRP